jgi:glycosyltransferase involved in cell wall biosynthesis
LGGTISESYETEARRRISAIARRVFPDVIHAHFGREGVFIAPVAKRLQIPLVVTFYGFDISSLPKQDGWAKAYKRLWRQVDAVTVLSNEMMKTAQNLGCPEDKLTVIHLSRDMNQFPFRSPAPNVKRALFVGRLTPKKAPLDAVKALHQANQQGADLHLDIVGDGEGRDEVVKYIETNALNESITLHGYLSNEEVSALMKAADVFLLPSKTAPDGDREGTPTVLLEAQATGLPCVTTHHAGIPEMIPTANHHLLADEGDVEGLANALCKLTKSPLEELRAIAQRGREKVEQDFSLSGAVEKLRSVYRQL